ncbi:hypothetical protein D3C87_1310330 [compost metagenome]
MLVVAAAGGGGQVVQEDDQTGQRGQLAHGARELAVARQFAEQDMEFSGQPDDGALVVALAGIVFQDDVFAQARKLFRRQVLRQAAHHGGFDQPARFEHVARFFNGGLGHIGAALGEQFHDLFVRQTRQHLADAGAADLEDLGQALFDQLGSGFEPVVQDGAVNALVDASDRVFAFV